MTGRGVAWIRARGLSGAVPRPLVPVAGTAAAVVLRVAAAVPLAGATAVPLAGATAVPLAGAAAVPAAAGVRILVVAPVLGGESGYVGAPARANAVFPALRGTPIIIVAQVDSAPSPSDSGAAEPAVRGSQPGEESLAAESPPAPVSPSQAELDAELQGELNAIFQRIDGLRNVRATVAVGVVTLSGRVPSLEERSNAGALASEREGVVYVDNQIRPDASLRTRLGPVLDRSRAFAIGAVSYLPLVLAALGLVLAFALLARWVGRFGWLYERLSPNPFAQNVIRQAVRAVVALAGVLLALQLLDATALVGAVLGAAGIAGLAVGFAFRTVAENYLAGVILSLRQPFDPDDHVVMESHEGKVVRLNARETILMTPEGNHVRIPNATVFNSVIVNYTRNPLRRFQFTVSIGDGEDLTRVRAEAGAALSETSGVAASPPSSVLISELGDGIVVIRCLAWVDQRSADLPKVRSEAIRRVHAHLSSLGISMPPTAYHVQMTRLPTESMPAPAVEVATVAPQEPEDVSVDRALDAQIEEDRRRSDEQDLLAPAQETEPPGLTS